MAGNGETPRWVLENRDRWRARFFASWGAVGILVLLAVVGLLAWRIRAAIAPFAFAALFTFLLVSPVHWLECRGFKRGWAIISLFVAAALVLTGVGFIVGPLLGVQLTEFATQVPDYLTEVQAYVTTFQQQYSDLRVPVWAQEVATTLLQSAGAVVQRVATGAANLLIATGGGVAAVLFDIVLGVILAFWILKDLPKLYVVAVEIAGPVYEDDLDHLVRTVRSTVGGYLRGQTIASAITGTLAGVGLAVIGVPYALLLALLTFVFNYVPYIGPFVTGLIAAVVGLFAGGPLLGLFAVLVVIASQQITDNLIAPRIMSDQVDLHPTLVIFSLLVGGTLFGIVGMLVAIPIAATVKGVAVYYWERRTHHPLSGPIDTTAEAAPAEE